jgi:hypothetical protein
MMRRLMSLILGNAVWKVKIARVTQGMVKGQTPIDQAPLWMRYASHLGGLPTFPGFHERRFPLQHAVEGEILPLRC